MIQLCDNHPELNVLQRLIPTVPFEYRASTLRDLVLHIEDIQTRSAIPFLRPSSAWNVAHIEVSSPVMACIDWKNAVDAEVILVSDDDSYLHVNYFDVFSYGRLHNEYTFHQFYLESKFSPYLGYRVMAQLFKEYYHPLRFTDTLHPDKELPESDFLSFSRFELAYHRKHGYFLTDFSVSRWDFDSQPVRTVPSLTLEN